MVATSRLELPEKPATLDVTRRFKGLRSVQWRIDLGVLPSSPSASTDELRRVTANSRRRYSSCLYVFNYSFASFFIYLTAVWKFPRKF